MKPGGRGCDGLPNLGPKGILAAQFAHEGVVLRAVGDEEFGHGVGAGVAVGRGARGNGWIRAVAGARRGRKTSRRKPLMGMGNCGGMFRARRGPGPIPFCSRLPRTFSHRANFNAGLLIVEA